MRKNSSYFTFSDCIDQFTYIVLLLLKNNMEPMIGYEIQRTLHFSDQAKIGDW